MRRRALIDGIARARRPRWIAAATASLLLLLAPAAPAADNRADANTLFYNHAATTSPLTSTTESPEFGTVATMAGFALNFDECSNDHIARTEWYRLEGTGTSVTITTAGTTSPAGTFQADDTLLAVYGSDGTPLRCNDEGPLATSTITLATESDASYLVQAGIYCGNLATATSTTCGNATARGGSLVVKATNASPPGNDNRASAAFLQLNSSASQNNSAATVEPGETVSCADPDARPYGKTVWWKFSTPRHGFVRVRSSGAGEQDSIVAVHAAGGGVIACDDDGGGGGQADMTVKLAGGEYLVQVGGRGASPAAKTGDMPVSIEFTPNYDVDGDGVLSPDGGGADCNDGDASVKPGVADAASDGVDANCDGRDPQDADRDGVLAPPDGADCNDASAAIKPGVVEIRGNDVDENCDGVRAPFPRVASTLSFAQRRSRGGTRLTRYTVRGVPAGAVVRLQCSGRGCPFTSKRQTVTRARDLPLLALFKKRVLRNGVKLTLTITAKERIGIVLTQRVVRGRLSAPTTQCLPPGATKPVRC